MANTFVGGLKSTIDRMAPEIIAPNEFRKAAPSDAGMDIAPTLDLEPRGSSAGRLQPLRQIAGAAATKRQAHSSSRSSSNSNAAG